MIEMTPIAQPIRGRVPAQTFDAIIVGGGHNGLVCAAYLAKAGKKVLVLEQRHILGGAASSDEIFPGFTFSVYSYVVSLFRPHLSLIHISEPTRQLASSRMPSSA